MTLQRKNKAYGCFAGGRFGPRDGTEITDEIALNPSHFKSRTGEQSLTTVAYEMAHLWQHHFGKSARYGYRNKEWAAKMHTIGLHPSDTGRPLRSRLCRADGAPRFLGALCRALGRRQENA